MIEFGIAERVDNMLSYKQFKSYLQILTGGSVESHNLRLHLWKKAKDELTYTDIYEIAHSKFKGCYRNNPLYKYLEEIHHES